MQHFRELLAAILVLTAGLVAAQPWPAFHYLPDWAQRWNLQWSIDYAGMDAHDVEVILGDGNTLLHGGYRGEGLARAQELGAHRMFYICSRTIYWERLFKTNPELKDATIKTPEGKPKVIYHNPARYAGCYNQPAWLKYILARVDDVATHGGDCIFFDNPMVWACYCPVCRRMFRTFTREKLGHEAPLPVPGDDSPPIVREAEKMFRLESAVRFFTAIHQHARDQGLLITANNLCFWLERRDITDFGFTEAFAHPPFGRSIAAYKVGLAAARGRPVGVLAYPPGNVRKARGVKTWHAPGNTYIYNAPPLPLEHEIGIAEGLACGGNYIANYGVTIGKELTDDEPISQGMRAAIKRYRSLARKHGAAFDRSQPGSGLAYVYDWDPEVRGSAILGMSLASVDQAARTFCAAGVPFDVIVEEDLTPETLRNFQAVILDGLPVLSRTAARAVGEFVRGGGGLILTQGTPQVRDPLEPSEKASRLSEALAGARLPELIRFRPEDFQLDGMMPDGPRLKAVQEGAAFVQLKAKPGQYTISVRYLDESDGVSELAVLADGKEIDRWRFDADDDGFHTRLCPPVKLKRGSEIRLQGKSGGGEYCRVYAMSVTTGVSPGAVGKQPCGQGRVATMLEPISGAKPANVRAACEYAAGPRPFLVETPDEQLFVNALALPEIKATAVHLVNYDVSYSGGFRDPELHPRENVKVRVGLGGEKPTVRLLTAKAEPQTLEPTRQAEAWVVTLPRIDVYACLVCGLDLPKL